MVNTLIPYGLEDYEEQDLRFFFFEPKPSEVVEFARWSRVQRVLIDDFASDLEGELRSFYSWGLVSYAVQTGAIAMEYARSFPLERMPVGGAAYQAWVEKREAQETILDWTVSLYVREADGSASGPDRLLLDEVRRELTPKLRDLVRRYQGKRDFLRREEGRRERERERERTRTTPDENAPPCKRKHRRWGELPPEPEIIIVRRSR